VKTLHFIRHGQTKENLQKIWQGHTETELDLIGLEQAVNVSKRLKNYNQVFSSDLKRAVETANHISSKVEKRKELREVDVGSFVGKKVSETYTNNPLILKSLIDDSFSFPNGESMKDFRGRVKQELDYLFSQTKENETSIVVTHGFFIGTAIGSTLGFKEFPYPIGNISNTSISTIIEREGLRQVNKFNDSIHLDFKHESPFNLYNSQVTFMRHGQTDSNTEGVWQGKLDNPLNSFGIKTAKQLSTKISKYNVYLSSPLKRTQETMKLATNEKFKTYKELVEIDLGKWEGMTTKEILENFRTNFINSLFLDNKSKYGEVGESLLEVGERVEKLIKKFKNKKVLISSHGGTIKAGVTKLLNLPDNKAASGLTIPNNLGLSTLVCENNQYQLWSYNVGEIGYENFTYNK
jgi:broad specificity phosphatase PhoE